MIMKLFTALLLLIAAGVCTAQEELNASLQKLRTIQDIKDRPTDSEFLQASSQTLQLWHTASPEEKETLGHRMILIHFERSKRLASLGNYEAAASELSEEVAMQKVFGGRIEFATKSPDAFFTNLIELQAQLTAETGSDAVANQVGYWFQKEGDNFIAARLELGDDIAGITVPGICNEEALALVYRIIKQDGHFVASAPKWFVVPKGRLPDVLKQATREVRFDSTGRMLVDTLNVERGHKSLTNFDIATGPSQFLPVSKPPEPNKTYEGKPTTPAPTSSTLWCVILTFIVAVIGLSWLLLKKRK